jgi:hypothetical protein
MPSYTSFKKAIPPKGRWTADELKIHLQQAVTLELTTIPLYLYAWYSLDVKPGANPKSDLAAKAHAQIKREWSSDSSSSPWLMMFHAEVAGEEMLHLGLVGNILKAVGGSPILSSEDHIPKYPNAIFKRGVMLNLRSAKNNMETFTRVRPKELCSSS